MATYKDRELLERTLKNEERMINAVENNTVVNKTLVEGLKILNASVIANNDNTHANIEFVKQEIIRKWDEDRKFMIKLLIILIIVLGAYSGLNIAGLL